MNEKMSKRRIQIRALMLANLAAVTNRNFPKERIRKRYERERIKIEKLLTLGYTTSGDP